MAKPVNEMWEKKIEKIKLKSKLFFLNLCQDNHHEMGVEQQLKYIYLYTNWRWMDDKGGNLLVFIQKKKMWINAKKEQFVQVEKKFPFFSDFINNMKVSFWDSHRWWCSMISVILIWKHESKSTGKFPYCEFLHVYLQGILTNGLAWHIIPNNFEIQGFLVLYPPMQAILF